MAENGLPTILIIRFSSFDYIALLHSLFVVGYCFYATAELGMGHYGGSGMMAAAIVHCVFRTDEHVCVVF